MIPWTAGGVGNGHLNSLDQTEAIECQDGGFDPTSEPIEEKEKEKERTAEEEEKFEKATKEEKLKIEHARALEGPHVQEPNQLASELGEDGFCDAGLADLIVNQIAVEQQNIVTDPLLNGWQDDLRNEVTDECRNFFSVAGQSGSVAAHPNTLAGTLSNQTYGTHSYYLNNAFNLSARDLDLLGRRV